MPDISEEFDPAELDQGVLVVKFADSSREYRFASLAEGEKVFALFSHSGACLTFEAMDEKVMIRLDAVEAVELLTLHQYNEIARYRSRNNLLLQAQNSLLVHELAKYQPGRWNPQ